MNLSQYIHTAKKGEFGRNPRTPLDPPLVCVCLSVCPIKIIFHVWLAMASDSAYRKYMTISRFLTCGFAKKRMDRKL